MNNRVRLVLVVYMALGFLVGQSFGGQAQADEMREPAFRHRTCRYNGANTNINWSRWEVRATINCAVDHHPTSRSLVFAIAQRESGLYHHAQNPTSGACGLFQFYPSSSFYGYWLHQARLNGVPAAPNCFNARSNALAAVRHMSRAGFGPWGG